MNSIEEQERYDDLARSLFWFERLLLFVILLFSSRLVSLFFCYSLVSTTFVALFLTWLCRKNSSAADRSGITTSRIWLFLFDRFMFLAALFAYQAVWLLRLTVIIAVAVHYVYIIQYLDISYKTHAELRGIDDESSEEGDVSKEVEKTRELLEYLKEDGKKMDTEMEFIDHLINPHLETHRRNLSVKLLALRKEMRDVGGKIRTYKELMSSVVNSEVTLIRSKVGEEIKVSREGASLADQIYEAYSVIQETAKAAKTTSDRAYLISLFAQEISAQIQNKRWMRRLDVEGLPELREEVRRMSLHFAATRMEAKVTADRAAQELSNARVKLMEVVGIRQWEECKID